jgi:methylaspartate mutase epsilon subunit
MIDSSSIAAEAALLASEAGSILEAIYGLSGDMFWESVYRAFQLGWLDLPFSPHADNANRLLTMRDANHSIRIVDPGAVPISPADAASERRLLSGRVDEASTTYRQILADIMLMV